MKKKVFGIVLALALVLSMAVVATPVGAVISNITVTQDNPIATGTSDYIITFNMQQPLEQYEYVDVGFPAGTDITGASGDIIGVLDDGGDDIGNTFRISLSWGEELAAGPVTVEIDNVENGPPCHQTLTVGTSQESAQPSAPYPIYLFEIKLNPGWNLISLPGIPEDSAIEVVLADLLPPDCDPEHNFEVWYYDCGQWYVWCTDAPYETLTTMDECRAYWIKADVAMSFKVKGKWQPDPPGPPLKKCYHECWNMVGFTSQTDMEAGDYLASLTPPDSVYYILGYDPVTGWVVIDMGDDLEVGQGYWMAFIVDACFVPPVV